MSSRTITTDAVGRSEAPPELATVEARIVGDGNTLSDARAIASDRTATLQESITTVSADRVRTVDFQVQHVDELFDPPSDAEYYAKAHIQIDCLPEQAGAIVEEVTDAEGQIQSVEFHLHEETRQHHQDTALEMAMERAREKAEHMAVAEGYTVAEVQEAMTTEERSGMDSLADEALGATSDTDLQPTPIAVSERVTVVYELSVE